MAKHSRILKIFTNFWGIMAIATTFFALISVKALSDDDFKVLDCFNEGRPEVCYDHYITEPVWKNNSVQVSLEFKN